jgi:outer membrane protein insertion porin family
MVLGLKFIRAALFAFVAAALPVSGALTLVAVSGTYAEAAIVRNIEVRGNSRMDADTIKSYLTIEPGQQFTNFDIDDSVKSLFSTGLFADVAIYQSGNTLIVEVDESGIVNQVFFEGNRRLKDQILSGAVQTSARSTYSEEKIIADVQRIEDAYSRVGREGARASYEVVPLANERVNVIFRIDEGDKTKIRDISFIGNDAYGERRLLDVMDTKRTHLFSWLKNDDIYDPDRLRADEERLRQFYFNNGYADFQVISTDVSFEEASNQYVIMITIDEGPRYTFGEVNIDSTLQGVDPESLYPFIETRSGDYYSSRMVEDSVIAITEGLAERGNAFVQVVPRGDRDFETNTINVTYQVDEGPRVYIQQINIVGNDRTREHVIRREFDMSEGDPLNQVLIQKTKRRLEALNFFDSVDITTRPGDAPDRAIVTVRVRDKATGEFSVGGGYSTSDGVIGEVSFSERNFLGRGQYLKVAGGFGTDEQRYSLSFTEPYFLGYRLSAGFDLYTSTSDPSSSRSYGTDSSGGVLRFGVPITDELTSSVFYTYNTNDTVVTGSQIDTVGVQGDTSGELSAALARNLSWTRSGFGYSMSYTDLDNVRDPRDGTHFKLSQTFYGAGGDAQFVQTTGTAVAYKTLSRELDLVGMLRARGGVNWAWGNLATNYRTQDNFFQGGRDIRGFESYGFGPRDPVTGDTLGGMYYWNASAEITFPFPYLPESIGIRGGFFADVGQLWGLDSATRSAILAANPGVSTAQLDDNTLRASAGASILWASPFGPLRFDYAIPLSSASWDKTREFSFGVSTAF